MFDFFFPAEGMGSQTLRLVAEAGEGGGDIFEIARVCREIDTGNLEAWEKAWTEKATDTEARAKKCLDGGHERSAMKYFFAANQYWRMADVSFGSIEMMKKRPISENRKKISELPLPCMTHLSR